MIQLNKILLSISAIFVLTTSSKARKQQQSFKANPSYLADSLVKKDSIPPLTRPVIDPKKGFDNLFVTSAAGNGMNTEQLNPLAINFVEDYIDRFGKTMADMKTWGKPYFDMMDIILSQHGLPKELKYLAVIESHLKSTARSWAGAVGPWQFMPATARNFGLRVSKYYDERTDYFKSTHAASRYLTDLFSTYGDWLLVIAAYNGGPGNVNAAIKKAGSKDFWALQNYLPVESKNHVKKFIATHYIMEGQGGITTVTKEEATNLVFPVKTILSKEELDSSKTCVINGRYVSSVLLKHIAMESAVFIRYNPDFDNQVANNGSYELRLPNGKMDIFLAQKPDILNESIQLLLKQAEGAGVTQKKAFR